MIVLCRCGRLWLGPARRCWCLFGDGDARGGNARGRPAFGAAGAPAGMVSANEIHDAARWIRATNSDASLELPFPRPAPGGGGRPFTNAGHGSSDKVASGEGITA